MTRLGKGFSRQESLDFQDAIRASFKYKLLKSYGQQGDSSSIVDRSDSPHLVCGGKSKFALQEPLCHVICSWVLFSRRKDPLKADQLCGYLVFYTGWGH